MATRGTVRMTTSIYTRPRLKQPLHCASQSSHDARCMSKQPQLAGNNASCHSHTQDQLQSSQAAMQRLPANIYSVAGRMQPYSAHARLAYDDINLHTTQTEAITALRVSTTARCTMPASSHNWLENDARRRSHAQDRFRSRQVAMQRLAVKIHSVAGQIRPYSAAQRWHARLRV